jgi:hypothetical protein
MHRFARFRLVALVSVLAVLAPGCYYLDAYVAEQEAGPSPWFCNPTAFNSVTGPGMGTTNWYAGITREPLAPADCTRLGAQLDVAQDYALQYPTAADAEAVGFRPSFNRIPGMGTHHGLDAVTPELLADPSFDPQNPIIPGIMDDKFNPGQPEFLQYDGNGPEAVLVGMSYYVRTDNGLPPAGFAGNNDWWHHHPTLCMDPATAIASLGVNTTDAACEGRGGINLHMDDYYMLHIWVVPELELHADLHAPMHPCIGTTSAVFDMDDPCHDSLPPAGATPAGGVAATLGEHAVFCPIGQLEEQWSGEPS